MAAPDSADGTVSADLAPGLETSGLFHSVLDGAPPGTRNIR